MSGRQVSPPGLVTVTTSQVASESGVNFFMTAQPSSLVTFTTGSVWLCGKHRVAGGLPDPKVCCARQIPTLASSCGFSMTLLRAAASGAESYPPIHKPREVLLFFNFDKHMPTIRPSVDSVFRESIFQTPNQRWRNCRGFTSDPTPCPLTPKPQTPTLETPNPPPTCTAGPDRRL